MKEPDRFTASGSADEQHLSTDMPLPRSTTSRVTENPLVMLIEESIRLRDSAQSILSGALGSQTLTRLEGLVLLSVTEYGRPLTVPQIGRILGHTRQVIQRAANRLVELGLLEKLPNPDHKTAALLITSVAGERYQQQSGDAMLQTVNSLLSDSDQQLCLRIGRDLRRLRILIENSVIPPERES